MNERNLSEFQRAFRNHRYEEVGDGRLLFSEQGAYLGGVIEISRNFGIWMPSKNLVVAQGRDYLLNAGLAGGTTYGNFYFAPYATNTAVSDDLTAANFNATMTEFVNYSETARQKWNQGGSVGGVISNSASVATITVGNGAQTSVFGSSMMSSSTRGSGSGVCLCCAPAATAKNGLEIGETLSFKYTITATSS